MGCGASKKIVPRVTAPPELVPEQHAHRTKSQAVSSGSQQPRTLVEAKQELEAQQAEQSSAQSNDPQNKSKVQNPVESGDLFVDTKFPAMLASLSTNTSHESYSTFKEVVWRRPNEFMNCSYDEIKVFDTIDINDIEQGLLGDCYFLSAISGLAEVPQRVQRLFESSEINKSGKYKIKFFDQGIPRVITVDDQFPCRGEDPDVPLFANPKGKELWVILLEKAWAKMFKSYTNAEAGFIYEALENLTGAPSLYYETSKEDEEETWSKIKNADLKDYVIGASSQTDSSERQYGITEGHAYTVISVHEVGGHRLLKLRNPWSNFEWNGDFSDSSPLWTDQLKKDLQYENVDDGTFYISVKDFRIHFREYTIHCYEEDWHYSYAQTKTSCHHANYYKFNINQPGEAFFTVHQKDQRSQQDPDYKYSPVVDFMIARVEKDGSYKLVFDSQTPSDRYASCGDRSIFMVEGGKIEIREAGDYIIRVKVNWRNSNDNTYTVSSYSSVPLTLQQIPSVKDFLAKYFSAIALQNQQESQLTDTSVCVSAYHKHYLYVMVKNNGSEEMNMIVTFTGLTNLRFTKQGNHSENKVSIKVPANSKELFYLKKVESGETADFDWDWNFG